MREYRFPDPVENPKGPKPLAEPTEEPIPTPKPEDEDEEGSEK
jgi:hypothetical protein